MIYQNIELDGIDTKDYPDFVDAYISYAEYQCGTELNDLELEALNENSDFVYEQVINKLF